jgi:hypothetical protein
VATPSFHARVLMRLMEPQARTERSRRELIEARKEAAILAPRRRRAGIWIVLSGFTATCVETGGDR